jgi:alpha-tubulin suppressor-like RCC1 family protein
MAPAVAVLLVALFLVVVPPGSAAAGAPVAGDEASASASASDPVPASVADDWYLPVTPTRLVDTRLGYVAGEPRGHRVGALGAGAVLRVPVAGLARVPSSGVAAVALSVTATEPSAATYLTVHPTGEPRLLASSLNAVVGESATNTVIAGVGADGSISVFNAAASTHVLVDLMGWFPAGGGFTPHTPERLADTRPGEPTSDGGVQGVGAVEAGSALRVPIAGRAGVPASGVGAVVLNVTATAPTEATYLTVHAAGGDRPLTSNLNAAAGRTAANLVITEPGVDGAVEVFNANGATGVVVDVLGWFADGGGYTAMTPARLADTRPAGVTVDAGVQGVGALGSGAVLRVPVTGRGGVPASGARVVAVNVTGVEPAETTYLALHPTGSYRPRTSNLNITRGGTVPNLVLADVGGDGSISIFNAGGAVHVVVDVLGWFPAGTPLTGVATVAAGGEHTCALVVDGTVTCWGRNTSGQLGDGTNNASVRPVRVAGLAGATAITSGSGHSCALLTGGAVSCWGSNSSGQLGTGSKANSSVPVPVAGLTGAIAVSAGWGHSCALFPDGTARCWGSNGNGELGNGTTTDVYAPVPVTGLTGAVAVAAGVGRSCALLTGATVVCWGLVHASGPDGMTTTIVRYPVSVPGLTGVTAIAVGGSHSCALLGDGGAACWGYNFSGQLGDGTTTRALYPVRVLGLTDAVALAIGSGSSCARRADGSAVCWGASANPGADGSIGDARRPVGVPGLFATNAISVGARHSCASLVDGTVRCWGDNGDGRLGSPATGFTSTPATVRT